jgi:hypothetical protein
MDNKEAMLSRLRPDVLHSKPVNGHLTVCTKGRLISVHFRFFLSLSLSLSLSLYGSTALWTLVAFSVSLIQYTVGRTSWTGDQPIARPLPTHRTTQTQNKRT